LEQGMITQVDYNHVRRSKLKLNPEKLEEDAYPAPYFVDYVKRWFLSNPKFGATYDERYAQLFNGGLRIETTLDPRMQDAAENAVNHTLTQSSDPYGALTAIDPRTGEIKAMVGGRDYFSKHSQFAKLNLATGGSTGRQAGSSFKPFVLVAALEAGLSPSKTYSAPGCIDIKQEDGKKPWHVCNAEVSGYGSLSIASATTYSVNTVYAQIIMDVGPEQAVKVAKQMGIRCCVGPDPENYPVTQPIAPLLPVPSAVLGSNETNTLEMASAFGTLATGGSHVQPTPVSKVTDADGRVIFESHPDARQVIDPEIADKANQILATVVQSGTGTAANIGRPQIGKTGTAQNYSDAWFVGAVPQLSAAVWVGFPEGQKSMCCTRIGTVFGGTWPAQIWRAFMARATARLPEESFPRGGVKYVAVTVDVSRGCLPNRFTPPGLIKRQTYISGQEPTKKCTEPTSYETYPVPSVIGMSKERAQQELGKNGFGVKVIYEKSTTQKVGFVMGQSPGPGTDYLTSKTVTITVAKSARS
jgi:membrane peptidoglycan carboxypeptidase